jgi:hypothetical protein
VELNRDNVILIEMAEEPREENGETIPGKVKCVHVWIGGRVIPLRYTTAAQEKFDEEMDMDFYTLQDKLNKDKKSTRVTVRTIRILGNEGLRLAGETADLTDDWLKDHIPPAKIIDYRLAALAALVSGWYMETDNSYEEKQDVVLNEIRKKNESTESPTGS